MIQKNSALKAVDGHIVVVFVAAAVAAARLAPQSFAWLVLAVESRNQQTFGVV